MTFNQNIVFTVMLIYVVACSSAIPEMIKPYSFADIILTSLSILLFLCYKNKRIILIIIIGLLAFLFSSLLGRLREFNVSEITSASLIIKWAGVLFVYFTIINNVKPSSYILRIVTTLQVIILISVMFDIKPFPANYYAGASGVFQASADGGYYLLCMLGVFLNITKINNSKIIYFNIFIALTTLLLIDSRFAAILGLLALTYNLLSVKGARFVALMVVSLLSVLFALDLMNLPRKLSELLYNYNDIGELLESDVSLLIRLNNFSEAFKISDFWTALFGNGGKFFQLSSGNFFEDNISLDNSYLYIFLSFGIVGILVFYFIFISNIGLSIRKRRYLAVLALAFPLMQDVFSNSFNLLTLGIIIALDNILYDYFYEKNFT